MAEPVTQLAIDVGALKLIVSTLIANAARAGASTAEQANAGLERLRQETIAIVDTIEFNNTSATDNATIEAELRRQIDTIFRDLSFSAD